jgi:hypothetical protein
MQFWFHGDDLEEFFGISRAFSSFIPAGSIKAASPIKSAHPSLLLLHLSPWMVDRFRLRHAIGGWSGGSSNGEVGAWELEHWHGRFSA